MVCIFMVRNHPWSWLGSNQPALKTLPSLPAHPLLCGESNMAISYRRCPIMSLGLQLPGSFSVVDYLTASFVHSSRALVLCRIGLPSQTEAHLPCRAHSCGAGMCFPSLVQMFKPFLCFSACRIVCTVLLSTLTCANVGWLLSLQVLFILLCS